MTTSQQITVTATDLKSSISTNEFNKTTRWFQEQVRANQGKVPKHLHNATHLTKFGELDMRNHKSLRAVERLQKAVKSQREQDAILRASEDNLAVMAS